MRKTNTYFSSIDSSVKMWILLAVVVALWILGKIILIVFTRFEKTITVRTNMAHGSGRATRNMVSDNDGNTYKVENVILLLHFDSAELQAKLMPGNTYKVKGFGLRIPFLGMYPIITDAVQV